MSGRSDRRGFLRDLVSLPLIGGGVTLIGRPSAVAAPVTRDLLSNYETWLLCEANRLALDLRPGGPHGGMTTFYNSAWYWHRERADLLGPETRAALVLSAVGCGWEGPRW